MHVVISVGKGLGYKLETRLILGSTNNRRSSAISYTTFSFFFFLEWNSYVAHSSCGQYRLPDTLSNWCFAFLYVFRQFQTVLCNSQEQMLSVLDPSPWHNCLQCNAVWVGHLCNQGKNLLTSYCEGVWLFLPWPYLIISYRGQLQCPTCSHPTWGPITPSHLPQGINDSQSSSPRDQWLLVILSPCWLMHRPHSYSTLVLDKMTHKKINETHGLVTHLAFTVQFELLVHVYLTQKG